MQIFLLVRGVFPTHKKNREGMKRKQSNYDSKKTEDAAGRQLTEKQQSWRNV